ncbi:MAG: protein-glutamate O-methyltransferase CheR [Thermodesulfobacteriota bacterium]
MNPAASVFTPTGVEPLSDEEFQRVRAFVYERSGLAFEESKRFLLESRVRKRLRAVGLTGVDAYLEMVRSPLRGAAELLELLDELTTHETSFFRGAPQLEALRKRVLPGLLAARAHQGERSLRVWSAACSSGEEPYTLAMLVAEALGEELGRWDARIVATDVSQSMLARARVAEYGPYSLRTAPAYFVQKYFEAPGPQVFRVRPEVARLVEVRFLNFADEGAMWAMRGFHLIFCRNALIYFDREARRRCVEHFARAVEPGGYLFVGHAESLHGLTDALKPVHFPGALAYRKPLTDTESLLGRSDP